MGLEGLDSQIVAQFVAVRRMGAGERAHSLSLALLLDAVREPGVAVEEERARPIPRWPKGCSPGSSAWDPRGD